MREFNQPNDYLNRLVAALTQESPRDYSSRLIQIQSAIHNVSNH